MNEQVKHVSWETYLSTFLEGLKIQSRNTERGERHVIDSPIFFRIDTGVLHISFFFEVFIICTKVNLDVLKEHYRQHIEQRIGGANVLSFEKWVNSEYMDDRGIEEV